jgi:hypothetical protein
VQFALELLLVGQLAAGCQHAVLRFQGGCVGSDRLGLGSYRTRCRGTGDALCRLGDLNTGDEAFQISLLLGLEIAALRAGNAFSVGLAHSAGTPVGAASGEGAVLRGLCVR